MNTTILLLFALSFTAISQQNFWEQTNGPYGGVINVQAINSKGYIFEGTVSSGNLSAGVFKSTDNGKSWEEINNGLGDLFPKNIYSIVINSNDIILIKTNGGFFNSTDDGEHWTKLNNPPDWQYFELLSHTSNN